MRYSVHLVVQQVLEHEVTTWLGGDWNSRRDFGLQLGDSASALLEALQAFLE